MVITTLAVGLWALLAFGVAICPRDSTLDDQD
jgi:hypothetical protein